MKVCVSIQGAFPAPLLNLNGQLVLILQFVILAGDILINLK